MRTLKGHIPGECLPYTVKDNEWLPCLITNINNAKKAVGVHWKPDPFVLAVCHSMMHHAILVQFAESASSIAEATTKTCVCLVTALTGVLVSIWVNCWPYFGAQISIIWWFSLLGGLLCGLLGYWRLG